MQSAALDKLQLERAWTDQRMASSINWHLYRSTHLHYVSENAPLLVWDYLEDRPRVVSVLTVVAVGASFSGGVFLSLRDGEGRTYSVNSTPREVVSGVFLWIPAFAELRFLPPKHASADSPRQLTLPMCGKTLSRADAPVHGHRYLSSMKEFCRTWPNANA